MTKRILTMCVLLLIAGCVTSIDPVTGKKTYKADPCTVAQIEQGAEGAIGILNVLGVIWPALLPVATAAGGVYATYKRTKPKLDQARTEGEMYHTATETLVAVIEDIKKNEPDTWAKTLKPLLESEMGQNIENVIRAIRGLPPKQ